MVFPPIVHILDLNFLDETHSIASFLIESTDGLVLIESGPETTFEVLKSAIRQKGLDWRDVKHLFLTHIHFDHAGAAWKFSQNGAKVYVHPLGLPHLQNPEKLWNSAKMIYKEDMERLWGEMLPIEGESLVAADDQQVFKIGEYEIKTHYTPGHAVHHNAYQINEFVFCGDVAGVKIHDGPVVPPCPPPDINIELWEDSLEKLEKLNCKSLFLTHFGEVNSVETHLANLKFILKDWANWMKPYYDEQIHPSKIIPKFIQYTQKQLRESKVSEEDIKRYEYANPSWMSVTGLLRYWKLKEQGRI